MPAEMKDDEAMALSKEDRAEVEGLVKPLADGLAKLTETIATLPTADKMGEAVKAQVEAATKPLSEAIAKIGPAPKPDDKKKDPAADSVAEAVSAALKPVTESIAKLSEGLGVIQKRDADAEAISASKALVEQTLKDMKRSGIIKNHPLVLERMIAARPKDAATVKTLFEAEQKYAVSLGAKAETFGADVAAEGGKTGEGGEGGKQDSEAIAKEILSRKTTGL
jgi:hypothetical protein